MQHVQLTSPVTYTVNRYGSAHAFWGPTRFLLISLLCSFYAADAVVCIQFDGHAPVQAPLPCVQPDDVQHAVQAANVQVQHNQHPCAVGLPRGPHRISQELECHAAGIDIECIEAAQHAVCFLHSSMIA
jgi:hypothetical protein